MSVAKLTMLLDDMPKEVKDYIIKIQGEAKEKKCIAQYSLQKALYQIVLEHKEMRDKVKKN